MKIKVEIDVSDLIVETEEYGEYSLKEELENSIRSEVVNNIKTQLKSLVIDKFKSDLQDQISKDLPEMVQQILEQIANQTLLLPSANICTGEGKTELKENVTISEFLISRVFQNLFSTNARKEFELQVDRISKSSISQFRDQFDQYFATQIVMKMGEQGLLKEDVGKMLIGGK